MSALDQDALLLEYGNVYVGDDYASRVDLGAVRNVVFTGVQNPIDILSDNRGSVVRKNRLNGQVAFDWLEAGNMDNMEILLKGLVTKTNTAGTPVAGATQALASPFVPNDFYLIENQNGDGTIITINSVTGATNGALTDDDDYHLVVDDQGKYGIVLNTVAGGTNITTLAQIVTIDYDYTPNASITITGGTSLVATERYVRIEGPSADDPTKMRIVVLEGAVIESDAVFPFLDTEEAGDVGIFPVTLTNSKNTAWSIEDQINPT